MTRKNLLSKLKSYRPTDLNEIEMYQKMTAFIESNPDCFLRSNLKGQVTGSAWIVDESWTHALLTHHRKLRKWLQPGGHSDGNSDILAVSLQEAGEETGLKNLVPHSENIFDIDVHQIPKHKDVPAHYHYDIRYLFVASKNETLTVSDESIDLEWVPLSQISKYNAEEPLMRLVRKTYDMAQS